LEILVLKRNGNIVLKKDKGNIKQFYTGEEDTIDINDDVKALALQIENYEHKNIVGAQQDEVSASIVDLGEWNKSTKKNNLAKINENTVGATYLLSTYPSNYDKRLWKVCFAILPSNLTDKNPEEYIDISVDKLINEDTNMGLEENFKEVLKHTEVLETLSDISNSLNRQYIDSILREKLKNGEPLTTVEKLIIAQSSTNIEVFSMVESDPKKVEQYAKFQELQEKAKNGTISEQDLKFLCDTAFGKDSDYSKVIYDALIASGKVKPKDGDAIPELRDVIERFGNIKPKESNTQKKSIDEEMEH